MKPQHGVALYHPEPYEEDQTDQVEDGLEGRVHQHHEEERVRLAYGLGQVLLRPLIQRLHVVPMQNATTSQPPSSQKEGAWCDEGEDFDDRLQEE